jgi:hypothetical protein
MEILGRIQNGVVVLEDGAVLPEGTRVTVSCETTPIWHKPGEKNQVEFPLVRSSHPGTLNLTNERIAEIFDEKDLGQFRESLGQSTE